MPSYFSLPSSLKALNDDDAACFPFFFPQIPLAHQLRDLFVSASVTDAQRVGQFLDGRWQTRHFQYFTYRPQRLYLRVGNPWQIYEACSDTLILDSRERQLPDESVVMR